MKSGEDDIKNRDIISGNHTINKLLASSFGDIRPQET